MVNLRLRFLCWWWNICYKHKEQKQLDTLGLHWECAKCGRENQRLDIEEWRRKIEKQDKRRLEIISRIP